MTNTQTSVFMDIYTCMMMNAVQVNGGNVTITTLRFYWPYEEKATLMFP